MTMHVLDTIYRFQTREFLVHVVALDEPDLDLSFDEDGEVTRQLDSGALVAFMVRASVTHLPSGVRGVAYLGGCIYKSIEDFRHDAYFYGMVREAMDDCRHMLGSARNVKLRSRG